MPFGRLTVSGPASSPARKRLRFMPGQMIVRVKEDAVQPFMGAAALSVSATSAGRLPETVSAPLDYLRRNAGLTRVAPLFSEKRASVMRMKGGVSAQSRMAMLSSVAHSSNEDLRGYNVCHVDPKKLTPALLKQMQANQAFEVVERMPARYIVAGPAAGTAADPELNLQWGLRAIRWFQANRPPAASIRVAVLDTGVDAGHPDLAGIVADYHHDGRKAEDIIGHGTHVSGIIAAIANNGAGIAGVAACAVEMWKVFFDEPDTDGEYYVDGEAYFQALRDVRDAAGRGVRVVNLSIGGEESSNTEQVLFRRIAAANITVAAAMGNEFQDGNPVEFPGAYDTVYAVGAIGASFRRARFSNTGAHIKIMAPGISILSTLPRKKSVAREETDYASWDGTSMATPHVAGAAALVYAKTPAATPAQVKDALSGSARKLGAMGSKSFTREYGSGLLDLAALLG